MNRIVLAGNSSPIIKLLDRLDGILNISVPVLFTEQPAGRELIDRSGRLGLELRDVLELGTTTGTDTLSAYAPDWLFNVNTTQIFPAALLEVPTAGCLNMHPGWLPEYAGLHAHQWAIRNGEESFGATLHWMVPEVDAGPIAYQQKFPILSTETGLSLFIKCANTGVELAVRALREITAGGTPPRIAQDLSRRRVYVHREALDGRIDWSMSARQIRDFVRAADYRPFQSPTYTPQSTVGGRSFLVREVREETRKSSGPPGTILAVDDDGIVLAAGDQKGVRVITVEVRTDPRDSKPRKLRGVQIGEGLRVSVGEVAQ